MLINEDEAFNMAHHYANEQPITELSSNQEEIDSRVVLYCMYAADNDCDCAHIKIPVSDIFWILLHHSVTINKKCFKGPLISRCCWRGMKSVWRKTVSSQI